MDHLPLGALPQKRNLCHVIQFVVYLDYVKFNWNCYTVKETDCQELASEEVGITEVGCKMWAMAG